ncbi:hypothetical protein T484DRAFT_1836742, partial [Baffinella frigidus]
YLPEESLSVDNLFVFNSLSPPTLRVYLLEESLSVDNLFVFLLLFEYFKVTL